MKKLFFAAAVLMCSLTAFAQTKEGSFNILPKAGINISNLSNKDNAKVKLGFTAGAGRRVVFYARCQIHYSLSGGG